MFESHRKYDTCILCGSDELTKEHVFGKKFAEFLNVKKNWVAPPTPENPFVSGPLVKGSSPITDLAPPLLCKRCNNARLGPTMDASLPLLKDMSQGKSISPTALDILKLKRYFERIALIVDVCTSNEQISEDRRQKPEYQQAVRYRQEPPILSFAERVAWLNGAPLQDSFVSLGSHDGVLGLNPDFTITYYLRVCKGDTKPVRRVKRVSLAINNIIACLEVGAKDDDMPPSLRPIDEVSSWPIVPTVSYDDYFSLRTQNPDTVAKRTLLQNNLYVAETERLTRLHGAFTLPGTQGGA